MKNNISGVKTDDAKCSGYGSIELANGMFRRRMERLNGYGYGVVTEIPVTIEATIGYAINTADNVGQEYVLTVRKVKFK